MNIQRGRQCLCSSSKVASNGAPAPPPARAPVIRTLQPYPQEAPSVSVQEHSAQGASLPSVSDEHRSSFGVLQVPRRILMGGGPTNVHPRILSAQSLPMLGYFQPPLLHIMNEIQEGLRYLMQTESQYICLLGASGHAGMEAGIANLIQPGEKILIVNQGVWGAKAAEMARRYGGEVINATKEPGVAFTLPELEELIDTHRPEVLFICQGESSTGVLNDLSGLGDACHRRGALLLVDAVCSIGGTPLFTDAWNIDCLYAGSQKCLSAPPGATPFMMSERAVDKLRRRRQPPTCYLFDMELNGRYWHWWPERSIHNTGLITAWYAMREALAIVAEEGLPAMWARHQDMHRMLWEGLTPLGLQPLVADPSHRLASVNAIRVPEGVDGRGVIDYAMKTYCLEIATGLPPCGGAIWRIGLLGYNAAPHNVALVLTAFREALESQGYRV